MAIDSNLKNMIMKINYPFISKNETFEHFEIKQYFYKNLPLFNDINEINLEKTISNQIADVYVELKNKNKIAIEIQHSNIPISNLIERTIDYSKKNVHVLWILNGLGNVVGDKKQPKNMDGLTISAIEGMLHRIYRGRVYYININQNGLESLVYSLHFAPYFTWSIRAYYKKYFSKKRSVIFQEIHSLKLQCYKYKYRLARFNDLNLKVKCENEMFNSIKTKCEAFSASRKSKKESNSFLIISINDLIKEFKSEYGYYLPFDVLKNPINPTKLKIKELRLQKDENGIYRESIKINVADYLK
ncbi:MAG: competence protein CoiA family protein [Promethearchaeota archaeon]